VDELLEDEALVEEEVLDEELLDDEEVVEEEELLLDEELLPDETPPHPLRATPSNNIQSIDRNADSAFIAAPPSFIATLPSRLREMKTAGD
jgi:hypothetical protein